jgi:hypothetical protein
MVIPGISNGEVLLIVALAAFPVALIVFIAGAGNALKQIGKGQFAVEFESDLMQKKPGSSAAGSAAARAEREAEIRQLLEAKAYRQSVRGESPLDVEAEMAKVLEEEPAAADLGADSVLLEEVRQLVVARNERRVRQGKEPLDVEAEVERQLRELEGLGQ